MSTRSLDADRRHDERKRRLKRDERRADQGSGRGSKRRGASTGRSVDTSSVHGGDSAGRSLHDRDPAGSEARGLSRLGAFLDAERAGTRVSSELTARVEDSLGRALPQVRLHEDTEAAHIADLLGARALTVGHDILLGSGERAGSQGSWALLAHELTHAAEAAGPVTAETALSIGGATDRAEHTADVAAAAAMRGVAGPSIDAGVDAGVVRMKRKGERDEDDHRSADEKSSSNADKAGEGRSPQIDPGDDRMVKAARNHLERLFPGVTGADLKDQPLPGGSQRFIDKLDDDSKDMAALVAAFQRAHLPGVGAHSLPGDLDEITLAAVLTHAVESGTDISSFMGSKAEQTADKDEEPLPGTKKAVLSPKQATEAAQWYLQGNRGKELLPLVPHIAKALGLGDRVTIDADFIDAIAKFQKQHSPDGNNGVDGKIGPATLALLKSKLGIEPEKKADPSGKAGLDAKNVWPKDKAPNKRYDHYAALLKQAGYSLDTANPKRPIVIGLRGLRQGARQTHRTKAVRDYDDTFVMLWKDKDGKKKIFEFKGATHPYQKGPNKYGGVAMIKGDMQYDVSTIGNHSYYGYKAPHVKYDNGKTTTGDVPAYRQKDYDGFYSSKGEDKQTTADAILFHPGYDTKRRTKNSKFSSIGCQTANGKDIERMTSIAFSGAEGGSKKGFDYILMNGDSAVKAADAAAKLRGQQEKAPEGTVRRHGHGDVDAKKALPTADRMLRSSTSSARPSADVVTAMRSAMGIDVGAVQLHFDGAAANAANVLNAEAFSVGNHVYFGTGRYQPKSADGLELLFHELAHTAQPSTGGVGAPGTGLRLGSATSVYEQAADHAARLAMASLTAPTTHAGPVKAATGGSTLRRRTRKKDADKDNDQAAPKKKTKAQTLTDKVLTAVTMTESNGVAVESRLNTSAGTKASYKSKVQATAIWAVDHIAKHPAIMKKFGITKEALAKGTARLQAGGRVYDRVMRSWGTADEFVKANQARLKAAGFTKTDVEAMMAFRDFKRSAARSTEKDAIAKGKKAGLDATSAKTYRRRARAGRPIWGEDAAAWEREALNRGGDGLGEKVQKAVEHDGGMTLGRAVIGAHVEAYLKRNPNASASAVVRYVARKHNPHAGSPYITKTWNHYKKLYGNR